MVVGAPGGGMSELTPALLFYEAIGGKLATAQTITIGGAILMEVAYGWEDISQLTANMHR